MGGLIDRTASEMTGNRMTELRLYGGITGLLWGNGCLIHLCIFSVKCPVSWNHILSSAGQRLQEPFKIHHLLKQGGAGECKCFTWVPLTSTSGNLSVPTVRLCSISFSLMMNEKCSSVRFTLTLAQFLTETPPTKQLPSPSQKKSLEL